MRIVCRLISPLIVLILCIGSVSGSAEAKTMAKVAVRAEKDGTAYLTINGRDAAHFETPNADLTPVQRATITAERLAALVQKGFSPSSLTTKAAGKNVRVMAGETLLMVVTPAEARAHRTTIADLGATWTRNVVKLLTLPPLTVSPSSLAVPVGETRDFAVQCVLPDQIEVAVSDPTIVSIDPKKKPGRVVVTGLGIGEATVTLKCQEYSASVGVTVKKYAAVVSPGSRTALVTGVSCPASLMVRAARSAAIQALSLEPGARIGAVSSPASVGSISPGESTKVPIQIEVSGANYLPARFLIPVLVENRRQPRVPTTWIMYSNNPESVAKYQTLFTGRLLPTTEAARLLFHHQNVMDRKIGFVIDIINPSQSPASVHVMEGVSNPMLDTVIVGYVAGLDFMQRDLNATGRVFDIPPGTRQILVSQALSHMYTASGIMEFRQLTGDPLIVRVTAEPEDQRIAEDTAECPVPAPGIDSQRIAMSEHIYPNPIQDVDVTYTAGKPWVFFRLGKDGLKHATEDLQLYGNYGVTYDIKAKLDNPLEESVTAEVAFEATAGPASGIFYVDGNLVKIKYLTPPTEVSLGKITIPAGKTRIVSIRTIPLSGSAYPATLIIRPVGTTGSAGG